MVGESNGLDADKWRRCYEAIRVILVDCAKKGSTTYYEKVSIAISSIFYFEPHDPRFHDLLGTVSVNEHKEGRPLLSCLVLHKSTKSIGNGFYNLGDSLGYDVSDKLKFWSDCLKETHEYWGKRKGEKI